MEAVAFAVGGFGLAYGAWSSILLRRWARECRGTRIAIAYRGKVKIDAPLVEWMLWARHARRDKEGRKRGPGAMIYTGGGTSVIIVQRVKARTVWKMKLKRWANERKTDEGRTGRKPDHHGDTPDPVSSVPRSRPG